MKKRIVSLLIVFTMICSLLPTIAIAAGESLNVQESNEGGEKLVVVTYVVPNAVNVTSIQLNVKFDTSKLEARDINWPSIPGFGAPIGSNATETNTNGYFACSWSVADNTMTPANLNLVTAKFAIKSGASGPADFTITDLIIADENTDDHIAESGATQTGATYTIPKAPISSVTIANLDTPIKGVAPDTSVTVTPSSLAADVKWFGGATPVTGNFAANTAYTVKIKLTASGGDNFAETVTAGDYTVTRNSDTELLLTKTFPATAGKDAPTCAAPTGVTAAFGSALSTITLTNSAANTPGKWYWMDDTQKVGNVKDNPHTYKAKFVPTDTATYATVENIDVTVNATKVALSAGSPIMIPIEETYTGSAIEPTPAIKTELYGDELVLGQDYEIVKYEDNTNVGTGRIHIAPLTNGNYSFTAGSYPFTIKPADSSISITSAPGKTYDGNVMADPAVSKSGSTGTVSYIYYTDEDCTTQTDTAHGAATSGAAPKNAGDYWVTATVAASGNYGSATSAAKKFTISPAEYSFTKPTTDTATINQSRPAGGAATATGVSGESVSGTLSWYTDSGCTSSATGNFGTVGTEDLYWKFTPAAAATNYVTTPRTGKVTFVISALPAQTVTFATAGPIAKFFGDPSFTNAASTTGTGTITYASDKPAVATVNASTGEVTIKGAGTAIITATAAETATHSAGQANYTLTVSPKAITPTVTVTGTYTYNGDPITPTYTVEITSGTALPTEQYDVELTDNTNAGTAHLKIKAKTGGNYSFTAVDQPFTIDKKKAPELTAVAPDQFTLFGVGDFVEPIVYGVKGEVLEGTITYHLGTDHYPNKAAVVAKLKTMAAGASLPSLQYVFDPTSDNYLGSKVGNFTITVKAKADVSAQITFPNGTLTYNGSAQAYEKADIDGITAGANPTWTYTYAPADAAASLDGGKPKTAGTYTVTATYEDDSNYGTKSATLTIVPKKVAIPAADTAVYTYDGTAQTYGIAGTADYTVSGNTQTDANETGHTVTVVLTDQVNTAWADGTTADKTYTFKIMKATPTGEPTCTKITTSGKTLADAPLANGTIAPAGGTLEWVDDAGNVLPGTTTVAANTTYKWRFTPTDANYKALTGSIELYHKSSGGGGGSSKPSYAVTVDTTKNGTVTVSPKSAYKGDTVTITVKPDKGYELDTIKALDKNGDKVKLTEKNGKYTFKMPDSKVEIKATFVKEAETSPFSDVSTSAYYYEAVKWAQKEGITGGIGNGLFGPNQPCTLAQIVTFLWRAAGSPEPKTMSSFSDVPAGSYYAKAVAWAVENGITAGTGDGKFSPNAPCTRGQSVTFLYRAIGTAPATANGFTDVEANAFCADAVAWAVENGVTNGTTDATFSPDNGCTRAQIVTFLYRAFNK